VCEHKHLLPIHWKDVVTAIILFFCSSIAGSSGLGGGGLFVPVLYLVNSFSAHEAVPLSKAVIFGGAIANYILNYNIRFPAQPNKLMIKYKFVLLMSPMILAGAMLGVTLNVMFPSWLILVLLSLVLCLTTWRMLKKGLQKRREENELAEKEATEESPLLKGSTPINMEPLELEKKAAWRLIPWRYVFLLILIESLVILVALFKGSTENKSIIGLHLCSGPYWGVFLSIYILVLPMTYIIARRVYLRQQAKQNAPGAKQRNVNWSLKNMIMLSIGSFIGGILAGLVGIGGGMVSSPILLEIGVHPQVVMTTSSFLILFTSSSTTIQYFFFGKLAWRYALAYGFLSFVANIFGNLFINWLVKKYKKTSLIIFIVCAVMGASAVMLFISGTYSVVHVIESGHGYTFSSICEV